MKIVRHAIIGMLAAAAIGAACYAADFPGTIRTAVDKKEVTIGEKVRYTITVSAGRDVNTEFPDLSNAFPDMEVIDSGEKTGGFLNKRTHVLWVVLQSFMPGTHTILKQAIRYRQPGTDWATAFSDECVINVVSLAQKAGAGAKIADIKGPLSMRSMLPVIVLAAAVMLGLAFLFRKKLFPACKKPVAVVQPWKAHEIAYSRLEDLRARGLLSKGMIKQYYSELSDILRHYLENRFSLNAPEMTTEEFIGYVREYSGLAREHKGILKEFLTNCDLVKFAKHIPPENEGEVSFAAVTKFIDQTKVSE